MATIKTTTWLWSFEGVKALLFFAHFTFLSSYLACFNPCRTLGTTMNL